MIFGIRAVIEAIDAGKEIDKILIRRDMSSAIGRELLQRLEGTATPIQKVPIEKLNQYTDKNHQGVIAFLSPIAFHRVEDIVQNLFEEGKTPLLMVLDAVTDVRNFGAIARTCVCAGVHALIINNRGSVAINGDAIKTSAGALHTLPVCKVENLQNTLDYLRDSGLRNVAATAAHARARLAAQAPRQRLAHSGSYRAYRHLLYTRRYDRTHRHRDGLGRERYLRGELEALHRQGPYPYDRHHREPKRLRSRRHPHLRGYPTACKITCVQTK